MRFSVFFVCFLAGIHVISALPFPFELGGDREDDDDVYYNSRPSRGWMYYRQPQHRSMLRSPSFGRYRNNGKPEDEDEEDEKNREKLRQALAAQQTVIETVMPVLHSIVPSTTSMFSGMMPRMRRSHESGGGPPEEGLDQLSVPSETSVSLILPTKQMTPESVAPSVVMPLNYQPSALIAERSRQDATSSASLPVPIPLFSAKEGQETSEDRSEDDADEDAEESSVKEIPRPFPSSPFPAQIIPRSLLPHPPDATITTGDDDKIYFAVDRKTILSFLGALFGADMRTALSSAMHENSVHKP